MIGRVGTSTLEALPAQPAEPIPIRRTDPVDLVDSVDQMPSVLFEALPAAAYVCDVAGLIVRYNQKAVELWGRTPKLGDAADRYCGSWRLHRAEGGLLPHPDCPMADVLRTGVPVRDQEVVIERPDGSRITASVNIVALHDSTGAIAGAVNCFQDVTERKRTEEAVRAREQQSRELLEALPAAVYTTDAAGRITSYNQAAVALWGRKPELGSDRWCGSWRLYWPDGRPMAHDECPMAVALREGRPVRGAEAVAERPDGTRVPFIPYPTPLRDSAGTVVGAVNMLLDISDRKDADEARAYLASIIESSDDAIVSKNLDGIVTSWNGGAEMLFGYRADEMIGRPIAVLIPPDRLREETVILGRLRRGERIAHYETVRRCKDGQEIDVSLTISPVRDANGRIVGASKIARDISARKRSQDALRHSEERYRGLAEAIAAVVWTTDAQGQVADMPQWRALTGQSFEQVRGWGWLQALHPDDQALTREVWTRAVKMRIPCNTEYRVRTASGAYRWFNTRGVPVLADDGTVREWVGVCIDITERKNAEDRASLLAREVNHRASNLLTIINAMMRQTRAETVQELIMAMQGRIGALSRVQNRLARDQWDRTDLLKLVGEELAPFGKDIAGRFQISGLPVPLSAEAAQALAIVIHELATNAVKYGALSISVGRVAVEWTYSREELVLSWKETGGPPVSPPTREGFGARAIALLTQQLEGDVRIEWPREGLACRLSIPAGNLSDSETAGGA
jgi:PAS domain S-box-containing protein